MIGRKIFYERTPSIVTHFYGDDGNIIIKAEPPSEFLPPVYALEDGVYQQRENPYEIKDDILSPKIWWFRK